MSSLFNESEADKEVINSLLREINKLRSELMSRILVDENGKFYKVSHFELLSAEEVQSYLDELRNKVGSIEKLQAASTHELAASQAAAPAAPPAEQPVSPTEPAAPAPAPEQAAAPATPPTEAPVAAEAPQPPQIQ